MGKRIILHVGAGKTGTSALQRFFFENETLLAKQGLALPTDKRVRADTGRIAHHWWAHHGAMRKAPRARVLDHWRGLSDMAAETILLSSEYLHNKVSEPDGPEFFAEIARLLSGHDIRIVFYIRRQSQWLQSVYAQFVKGELQHLTFPEFVARYTRNPAQQILDFAKIFGASALIVRPYEAAQFHAGTIEADFCHAVGLEWSDAFVVPEGNPNPRLVPEALEVMRRLNGSARSSRELEGIRTDLLAYSAAADPGSLARFSTHELLDVELQRAIEEDNAPLYRRIAQEFMGRADGVLFQRQLAAPLATTPAPPKGGSSVSTSRVEDFLITRAYRKIAELQTRLEERGETPAAVTEVDEDR